eukprot:CFRG3101T1
MSGPLQWRSVRAIVNDPDAKSALIILNWPLIKGGFEKLWDTASVRVCADGGANRLYDDRPDDRERFIPNAIKGDLDSLRPEVRDYYKAKGTIIIPAEDQIDHDLNKSISYVLNDCEEKFATIWIVGGLDGRFDHTFAAVASLRKWLDNDKQTKLHILTDYSEVILLRPGQHQIHIETTLQGPHCGLLPMGGVVRDIFTTGLRWNLNHDEMSVTGIISSSNKFEQKYLDNNSDTLVVTVDTSDPVVWTSEIDLVMLPR